MSLPSRQKKKVPQLIREIRKTRCSDFSDSMDALRLVDKGTVNERMRPGIEFKGYAFTVKLLRKQDAVKPCETIEEWRRELGKGCSDIYRFVDEITPERAKDMVAVIDMDGVCGGVWGSEIAMNTMIRGISGAVVDGVCRDSYETNLEKANVFCTSRTFTHAYGRVTFGGTNIPVNCAGVMVKSGDIICADDDGVLVIPYERAEEVIRFARMQLEEDIKSRGDEYRALGFAPDEPLKRLD